ncbi:MAG: YbjN domain-containing protein [Hyphomonadaceae bacterium]|nr:YbjN domain-containing protein [Hyphomonadaceae bacterium]
MDLYVDDESLDSADPLDVVEAIVASDDRFAVERADDGDVQFSFDGPWAGAAGYFSFREELPALLFTLGFDLRAPMSRLGDATRLAALINENLWLGHFDVWSDDGSVIFRHSLPMIGRDEISMGEIQALLAAALDAADRFYPAFAYLFESGRSPEDAAKAAMFETAGEA